MTKTTLKTILLGSVIFIPTQAFAQNDIEEIVVTANRSETPVDQVGAQVEVLTRAELEARQYTGVLDALEAMVGVSINQSGSFGGQASVRIRGASSEQTLILIDGIEVNDPTSPGGGFDFSSLNLWDVERIEVIKGPQSTLYGSDAIGGVINIITSRGDEENAGSVWAEGGSYKTARGGATLSGKSDNFTYRLSGSGTTTEGISKADERDGNTEKDGFKNIQLSTNLEMKASDAISLFGNVRWGRSETEFDVFGFPTGVVDGDDEAKTKEYSYDLGTKLNFLEGKLNGQMGYQKSHIKRENFSGGNPSFDSEGARKKLYSLWTLKTRSVDTFVFGFEREKAQTSGTFAPLSKNKVDSFFGHIEKTLADRLSVTLGLRNDNYKIEGEDESTSKSTYRSTLNYHFPDTRTILRASLGSGFKAPTIFQSTFFCCGATEPNPNLKPETSEGFDIGLEQPLGEEARLNVSYFTQNIENLITFSFLDGGYSNLAKSKTSGVEASLGWDVERFHADVNYTLTNATDKATGDRLLRVPRHELGLNLSFDATEDFTLGTSFTHRSNQEDVNGTIEAASIVGLRAQYKVSQSVELYGRFDNLLDKDYQTVFGYGTPGASAYLGVRARF